MRELNRVGRIGDLRVEVGDVGFGFRQVVLGDAVVEARDDLARFDPLPRRQRGLGARRAGNRLHDALDGRGHARLAVGQGLGRPWK